MTTLIKKLYALAPRLKADSLHDDLVAILDAAPEWIRPLLAALLSLWRWEQGVGAGGGGCACCLLAKLKVGDHGPMCSACNLKCHDGSLWFMAAKENNSAPLIAKLQELVKQEVEAAIPYLCKDKDAEVQILYAIKTALAAAPHLEPLNKDGAISGNRTPCINHLKLWELVKPLTETCPTCGAEVVEKEEKLWYLSGDPVDIFESLPPHTPKRIVRGPFYRPYSYAFKAACEIWERQGVDLYFVAVNGHPGDADETVDIRFCKGFKINRNISPMTALLANGTSKSAGFLTPSCDRALQKLAEWVGGGE
jgi:hypothetical protein